jgi:CRISPR-associated endonuclease/helicase Cas3
LQTGLALQERIGLGASDLAVMVGSAAVRELFEANKATKPDDQIALNGSESAGDLLDGGVDLVYDGGLADRGFGKWLRCAHNPRAGKLLDAPILVCTIDHLMPSVEATRGGHQIVPLLRLLTSDLVLDEPDDFGLEDLPALSRLVYFSGLFGSRVLISSATLAPAIVQGLFEAYRSGRSHFQANRGVVGTPVKIVCAWFDEFENQVADAADEHHFKAAHDQFVGRRLSALDHKTKVRRRGRIAAVETNADPIRAMTAAFLKEIHHLHCAHAKVDLITQKRVSFGLIRMANIDPLIDVAKLLFQCRAQPQHRIHLCVYHSRHPMAVRSEIERVLEAVLNRNHRSPFDHPLIRKTLDQCVEPNHIFVVLASPVIETGRDLCADWAIAEPSSMRSVIQLAGRVMRHLDEECLEPNIVILDLNRLALQNPKGLVFVRPGFESGPIRLNSRRMSELLLAEEYAVVSAKPRLALRADLDLAKRLSLTGLEHERLALLMLAKKNSEEKNVRRFWESVSQFTGYEQNDTRFRASRESTRFAPIPDENNKLVFYRFDQQNELYEEPSRIKTLTEVALHPSISHFTTPEYLEALQNIGSRMGCEVPEAAKRYGTIELPSDVSRWLYEPMLGFQRERSANKQSR